MSSKTFWKGARGEWYLVVQTGLFLLLAFGPRSCTGVEMWNVPCSSIASLAGAVLLLAGTALAVTGAVNLGKNLTPLPDPKENATLIISGSYRLVRHPIYSGLISAAFGWGLWLNSWLTIVYALALFAFFDFKSRREERLLEKKFPEYAAYRDRIRKLLPFIY